MDPIHFWANLSEAYPKGLIEFTHPQQHPKTDLRMAI